MKDKDPNSGMHHLRGACGVNRMDGESNKCEYGAFGIFSEGERMNVRVMEMAIV